VGVAPGTAASHFSISETGSVVFMSGPASPITTLQDLAIVDRSTGNVAPLKLLAGSYQHARVSPDGSRIAFGTDDGKEAAVYSYALDGSTSIQRRTFGGNNRYPIWSADGTRITFQSDRDGDSGIFWQPADGTGIADRLTTPEQGAAHIPDSWSPSGEILLFTVVSPGTPLQDAGARARSTAAGFQLWAFSRKERTATRIPGIESVNPIGATFAPDGRWFAYSTNSPSQTQSMVFVEPYPPTGAKYQISKNDDSHHPIWSRDGKELFVTLGPNSVSAFSVQTQPTFTYGSVIPSAAGRMMADPPNLVRNHDVLLDGKRFVDTINANQAGALSTTSQVEVILNWAEELKTRVPIH
jgi:Tol biopolymer transport system component